MDLHSDGLWTSYRQLLSASAFVDLTHSFASGQPCFDGFPDQRQDIVLDYDRDGSLVHYYSLVGQWGTHVDPPAHFVQGGRTLDDIPVAQMFLPLVVLDISHRVGADPDTAVTLDDLAEWELRNGDIIAGCFVALRTDWSRRWPDGKQFRNPDRAGVFHTPGWSLPVLQVLLEHRGVVAIGHETLDTDPGCNVSNGAYPLERYVLEHDRWQIEAMTNLDKVPETGSLLIASWAKPKGGSGFPARAVAIVPVR